jgi:hypothetical protein
MENPTNYNSDNFDQDIFWKENNRISEVLISDLNEVVYHLVKEDTQLWRRTYCRTLFAFLEGETFALRQIFLFFDWFIVDEEYEDKIRNIKRILTDDGSENFLDAYLPLVQNVKLLINAFAIASDTDLIISSNDKIWELLAASVKIRNRIVHPKRSTDLIITDNDLNLISGVHNWFVETSADLLAKRAERDIRTAKALDETAEKVFGVHIDQTDLVSILEELRRNKPNK